jgi:two-component system, LytTR family, sensor histidine kinase AlgZ
VHPILSNIRALIAYLSLWLIVGLLFDIPFFFQHTGIWLPVLLTDIPNIMFFALLCLSSYYICKTFPLQKSSPTQLLTVFGIAAIVVSFVMIAVGTIWISFIDELHLGPSIAAAYATWTSGINVLAILAILMLFFLFIAAVHYIMIFFQMEQESKQRVIELNLLTQDAELRALRAQINPHFLFNSLNSISALTTANPEQARHMTILLADFFRKSLDVGTRDAITVADELSLISDYLTIEQVRFGKRLQVQKEIDPGTVSCLLPPLILQPLVENAVRHGIANMLAGGTIRIQTQRLQDQLQLTVENPIDPETKTKKGTGLGIRNVRARLEKLYNHTARVDVVKTDSFYRITLTIPANEKE